jgi:drug/metabolite transporter (DMT)-like permease
LIKARIENDRIKLTNLASMTRAFLVTLFLEAALVICWSSGFIGAKLASETPAVFLLLFWRFLFTSIGLLPFVWIAFKKGMSSGNFWVQFLVGFLAMGLYLALGVKSIDLGVLAGTSALISALQPLLTVAAASLLLREDTTARQWLGLFVGLIGVSVAVGGSFGATSSIAYSFAVIGVLAIVAATIVTRMISKPLALLPTLGIQCMAATLLFLPLAIHEGSLTPVVTYDFVFAIVWFIILSTIGAYGFFWLCLRQSSTARVSSLIYFTPPVTAVWAWFMFGEPITVFILIGFAICLVGVMLAARSN